MINFYVITSKLKTIHKRWRNFKYDPFYEICPSCGMYLCSGSLNEKDEVCCQFCGNTKLPARFLKTVDMVALKLSKATIERVNKAAEEHGMSPLQFIFNPDFVNALAGETNDG